MDINLVQVAPVVLPLWTADLIKALLLTTAIKVLTQGFTHCPVTGASCQQDHCCHA